jgi:hypothetical protein
MNNLIKYELSNTIKSKIIKKLNAKILEINKEIQNITVMKTNIE